MKERAVLKTVRLSLHIPDNGIQNWSFEEDNRPQPQLKIRPSRNLSLLFISPVRNVRLASPHARQV